MAHALYPAVLVVVDVCPLIVLTSPLKLPVLSPFLPREGKSRTHVRACLLTVSDRASQGVYDDLSGPAMRQFLENKVRRVLTRFGLTLPGRSPPLPAAAASPGVMELDPLTGLSRMCIHRLCFFKLFLEKGVYLFLPVDRRSL